MPDDRAVGPLSHLKVLELGSFIAGPYCGQILADLGAEVIKVEPPGTGDTMRQWGAGKGRRGQSLWWSIISRNKLSLTLDLRHKKGRAIARSLALQSDVVIENFRPGTLERWGLGPDELRAEKPELIFARVSGFGQTGPYAKRGGFASVAESMAGLRHLTGYPDRPPTRVGISIGDSLAGLFATIGVLAALAGRDGGRGGGAGRGEVVDVAIVESVLAVLETVVSDYAADGVARGRTGTFLPGIAPSNLYPTADGQFVIIAANADGLFARLCRAMERSEWIEDPRFATHADRGLHQQELDGLIADWTATRTADDLVDLMAEHGVPAGPVNDAAGVAADPHLRAREAIIEVPDGDDTITMQGVFPRLADAPGQVRWCGPALGAHTDALLAERLGMDAQGIAALHAEGIV